MSQNRPDLIKRFVGIASNIITYKILIKAELKEDTRNHYIKEVERDIDIALKYRSRINPINDVLPPKDAEGIRNNILLRVKAELLKRKDKGYNVDILLVNEEVDNFLKEQDII